MSTLNAALKISKTKCIQFKPDKLGIKITNNNTFYLLHFIGYLSGNKMNILDFITVLIISIFI